jgi:hypothetical protein
MVQGGKGSREKCKMPKEEKKIHPFEYFLNFEV